MKRYLVQLVFTFLLATYSVGQGQWAWMKGDTSQNTLNGAVGFSDPTYNPGARYASIGWFDGTDGLWMYSGQLGFGSNNFDLWRYSISANEWEWVQDNSNTITTPIYGPLGVPMAGVSPGKIGLGAPHWVTDSNSLWTLSSFTGDMFRYDIDLQNWAWMNGPGTGLNSYPIYGVQGVPADSLTPGNVQANYEANNQWVDSQGNLWLYHGLYGTVWKYSTTINQWALIHGNPGPSFSVSPVYSAIGAFDDFNTPGAQSLNGIDDFLTWQDSIHHFWLLTRRINGSRIQAWEFDPELGWWACHLDEENTSFPLVPCEESSIRRPKIHTGEQRAIWVDNCDNAYVILRDSVATSSTFWRFNPDPNGTRFTLINSYSDRNFGTEGILDGANNPGFMPGSISWTAEKAFWYKESFTSGNSVLWKYVADTVNADFNYSFDSLNCNTHFYSQSSSGCNSIKSWFWDFGDGTTSNEENPTHFYDADGTYQITLIVENCTWDVDTLIQSVAIQRTCPIELSVEIEDSICQGDCVTLLYDTNIELQSLLINGEIQTNLDSIEICPEFTSDYIIGAIGENGTMDIDTLSITVFDLPTLIVEGNQTLCPPDSLILESGGTNALTFLWSTGSTADSTVVYEPGIYWVLAQNEECFASDTISVALLCDPMDTVSVAVILEIPNVFTPSNHDGINDIFEPIEYSGIVDYKLSIFNRWGNVMFESTKIDEGWDGTYGEEYCQAGTYFWIVIYTGADAKTETIHGNLTLIR